ncbi:smr domain-containing protein [[Candida] jaroonii]|uniref:Smr domain-containing protein n=1 Tax=[Candida] jaroonii TaxID=467808 RepID=A0ACA9YF37_9ASCO|nr:smr domain-containing protein [[Candida] jaroonii]
MNKGGQFMNGERDYNHATDSNYKSLRQRAEQLYEKRNHLSQESQKAYKNGDGQKAHDLSEQAKKITDEAEYYNRQAAEYVFRENNADSAEDEIDLHGLFVKEAEYILQVRIVQFVKTHQSHLKVIVGKGLHSQGGIAKLKPAIDDMCDESRLKHHIDSKNTGVLVIDLKNVDINQLPQSWLNLPPPSQMPSKPQQSYQPHQQPQYNQQYHKPNQQQHHNNNNNNNNNQLVSLLMKVVCMCINSK